MSEVLRRLLFLPEQASTYALRVDRLHYFVILTTLAASAIIGATALYWLVRYRRRAGRAGVEPYHPPRWAEALIVVVPLSFFLLWVGLGFRDFVWLKSPPREASDVYVMAKQWMWKFSYPGGPSAVDVLTVPRGRPIRLLLTSRDVIHSFFVPALRLKQDALPGRYTEIWFEARQTGRFQVLCAEFCGTGHSAMLAELVVLPPAEYDAWLAAQRRGLVARQDASGPATIADEGRTVATRLGCLGCHSSDGSPHIGPTWLDLYRKPERLADGQEVTADEAYLTESMMDPLAKIVAGYAPVMPTFQGRMSAPEAAAVVEYIKSLQSGRIRPGPSEGPAYEPARAR